MIQSKEDLRRYIKADFDAQAMEHPLMARFTFGENWAMFKYMKTLRKLEYYINTPPTCLGRICKVYYLLKHRRNCLKYGMHIAPNIVGEGCKIVHPGFRRIDEVVGHVGKNCTLLPMVLFGKKKPEVDFKCIEVGENCYFGTGCTILGPVKIGDNVTVGAGAVVTHDIPSNSTVVGVPAEIVTKE